MNFRAFQYQDFSAEIGSDANQCEVLILCKEIFSIWKLHDLLNWYFPNE